SRKLRQQLSGRRAGTVDPVSRIIAPRFPGGRLRAHAVPDRRFAPSGDCIGSQVWVQGWSALSMALAATARRLAMATRATLAGFPASRRAWYSRFRPLSERAALRAAM